MIEFPEKIANTSGIIIVDYLPFIDDYDGGDDDDGDDDDDDDWDDDDDDDGCGIIIVDNLLFVDDYDDDADDGMIIIVYYLPFVDDGDDDDDDGDDDDDDGDIFLNSIVAKNRCKKNGRMMLIDFSCTLKAQQRPARPQVGGVAIVTLARCSQSADVYCGF